jgi:hypothetical protein
MPDASMTQKVRPNGRGHGGDTSPKDQVFEPASTCLHDNPMTVPLLLARSIGWCILFQGVAAAGLGDDETAGCRGS